MNFVIDTFNRLFFSTDKNFIPKIERILGYLKEMSEMLVHLSKTESKIEKSSLCVRVQELEKKVHQESVLLIIGLDHNFLTEISREDLMAIAKTTERIAERILEACNTIDFFLEDVEGSPAMIELCNSIKESICAITICFKHLNKPVKSRSKLKYSSAKISQYNKFAEKSYRMIKAEVLREKEDAVNRIKLSEWLDRLNDITEQCVEMNYIYDQILVKK